MPGGAFTPQVRAAITNAHPGCVGCGRPVDEVHHVRPRGMGGTSNPDIGVPWNGLGLCRSCHAWAESHRATARALGWLTVRPSPTAPYWTCRYGWCTWTLLDDAPPCWCVAPFQSPPSPDGAAAIHTYQHTRERKKP